MTYLTPQQEAISSAAKATPDAAPVDNEAAVEPKSVASRITGWTNNLIATAVIVVMAIAIGTQLTTWLAPSAESDSRQPPTALKAWPSIESCGLVFGDSPYQLIRDRHHGDLDSVFVSLKTRVSGILESSPDPAGPITETESRMLADAETLQPDEKQKNWRLFQVRDPLGRGLPTVIGIRDDCRDANGELHSRMVAWGIALGSSAEEWNLFTCYAAKGSNQNISDWVVLPEHATMTMCIEGDPQANDELKANAKSRNALIGFQAKSLPAAQSHFDNWTRDIGFTPVAQWRDGQQGTHRTYVSGQESLQVQLMNGQDQLRGLLLVDFSKQRRLAE